MEGYGWRVSVRNIYLCEDNVEGIFSAIYLAYEQKKGHKNNAIHINQPGFNRQLFCDYISVETDYEKATKVARTIRRDVSEQAYEFLRKVSVSHREDRADAMYRFVIEALHIGCDALRHLTAPHMQILCEIERGINNEVCHWIEFLRFQELENGILFGRINPKSAILPYMSEHFTDRFWSESWVIADTVHHTLLIHKKKYPTIYANMDEVDVDELKLEHSEEEIMMQELWKMFVDTIAIKERINPKLQRQLLPLHFRKYMKEFSE